MNLASFYKNKTVLITGNTGFKGAWLTEILIGMDAKIIGYALETNTIPSLYKQLDLETQIKQIYGDIRDFERLTEVFEEYQPEIVFHLAAQPLVIESYLNPRDTYEINAMGTVNVLECCRLSHSVISVINVTTDKVYKNNEWMWSYREHDILNGYDPYSNSKSLSELITETYIRSFLSQKKIPVSTMRAGNVIGGGDYADNRIIPDCVRAAVNKEKLVIRNPLSIRPYQHVLEPLFAYLNVAMKQCENIEFASAYNIGPNDTDCVTTKKVVSLFNRFLVKNKWEEIEIEYLSNSAFHEANLLKLDCTKYKNTFHWNPVWDIETSIKKVVEFLVVENDLDSLKKTVDQQIKEYIREKSHE